MSMRIRRGGVPDIEGGEIFGPTNGAQSVRDNAGPRPITVPSGAIGFASTGELSLQININQSGSSFVALNNIDWTGNVNATAKAPKIYVPNNRIMNGGGRNIIGLSLGNGAEVHGGVWTNFGSSTGQDFHQPIIASGSGSAKVVQDATFHTNFNKGVHCQGSNVTFDHCLMHTNGRYGWGGSESAAGVRHTGFEITNCEWYNNNTRGLPMDFDAGGNKVLACLDTYVANCWGHDNQGAGLWFDFNPGAHIVEENVFEDNARWGFFYEVGTGVESEGWTASAQIRNNHFLNNVTSDDGSWFNSVEMLASCSDGAMNGGLGYEIHHNIIDSTHRALGFVDHNCHPFDVRNFSAHDNDVYLRTTNLGRVGGEVITVSGSPSCDDIPYADPFAGSSNNDFTNNHYHVQNTGLAYWRWNGTNRTWAQWQALGHDTSGSLEGL